MLGLLMMAQVNCKATCLRLGVQVAETFSLMSVSGSGWWSRPLQSYRQTDTLSGGR